MSLDDAEREGHLPILGTIGLASSLVDHAPGRLIFLVAAEAALFTLGQKLVDRLEHSAHMPWSAKEVHFVVDEVVYAIMTGAIVVVAYAAAEGRRCGVGAALRASAMRFGPMLLVCAAIDFVSALDVPFSHLASLVIGIFSRWRRRSE